jgi:hypothetical protein
VTPARDATWDDNVARVVAIAPGGATTELPPPPHRVPDVDDNRMGPAPPVAIAADARVDFTTITASMRDTPTLAVFLAGPPPPPRDARPLAELALLTEPKLLGYPAKLVRAVEWVPPPDQAFQRWIVTYSREAALVAIIDDDDTARLAIVDPTGARESPNAPRVEVLSLANDATARRRTIASVFDGSPLWSFIIAPRGADDAQRIVSLLEDLRTSTQGTAYDPPNGKNIPVQITTDRAALEPLFVAAPPVPEPEPDPRVARVAEGAVVVGPGLPPEVVSRVVRHHIGELQDCYAAGLKTNAKLVGHVAVRFVIDHKGTVAFATNNGTDVPNANVVTCLVSRFMPLEFPVPSAPTVTVTYTIVLTPPNQ